MQKYQRSGENREILFSRCCNNKNVKRRRVFFETAREKQAGLEWIVGNKKKKKPVKFVRSYEICFSREFYFEETFIARHDQRGNSTDGSRAIFPPLLFHANVSISIDTFSDMRELEKHEYRAFEEELKHS